MVCGSHHQLHLQLRTGTPPILTRKSWLALVTMGHSLVCLQCHFAHVDAFGEGEEGDERLSKS
jgi:hypothetical protein